MDAADYKLLVGYVLVCPILHTFKEHFSHLLSAREPVCNYSRLLSRSQLPFAQEAQVVDIYIQGISNLKD